MNLSATRRTLLSLAAIGIAIEWSAPAAAAITYRTVAVEGAAAPGTSPGVVFADLGPAPEGDFSFNGLVFNNAGQVAFRGFLGGVGVNSFNNQGIWSEGGGSLRLVAREGYAAPGTAANFGTLVSPVLNDAGQTAFRAFIRGGNVGSNDEGIWSEGGGSLTLVARRGSPAPGTASGVNFGPFITSPLINNVGQVAFKTLVTGTGVNAINNTGIWAQHGGELRLVARGGAPAPGTGSGVTFESIGSFLVLKFNDSGKLAFDADLVGTGVNFLNDNGVWSEANGNFELIARSGSAAPGTPSGTNFFSLLVSQLGNSGVEIIHGRLVGEGVSDTNNEGLWKQQGGMLQLIAREGAAPLGTIAPGTDAGVNFLSYRAFTANEAGHIRMLATLTGPGVDASNDEGIWTDTGTGFHLVAREGMDAPGTSSGVKMLSIAPLGPMNQVGQTVIGAQLSGVGVDDTNDSGIWVQSRTGLELVMRTGELYKVGPGDFRAVTSIDSTPINDLGQLAFLATFADGTSGIFVADLAAIPEPASAVLVLIAAAVVSARGRPSRTAGGSFSDQTSFRNSMLVGGQELSSN